MLSHCERQFEPIQVMGTRQSSLRVQSPKTDLFDFALRKPSRRDQMFSNASTHLLKILF